MHYAILANLKLAKSDEIPQYIKCGASSSFPGYNYFVTEEGKSIIDAATGGALASIEEGPEAWICSKLNTSNIKEFESVLFDGFSDMRSTLSRMLIVSDSNDEEVVDDWIEANEEDETEPIEVETVEEILKLPQRSLPPLADQEILSFADYDAIIDLLKMKQYDAKARRLLYMSMLETLYVTENKEMSKFANVLDVFFANLLVAIQQCKYVCPDEAKQFMSFMMKSFIIKDKKGI